MSSVDRQPNNRKLFSAGRDAAVALTWRVNELESHYARLSRPVSSSRHVARVCVSNLINQRLSYCVVNNETMTRVRRFPLNSPTRKYCRGARK